MKRLKPIYPDEMISRARELRGGFEQISYPSVRRQLEQEFGSAPCLHTLEAWCDPARLAAKRRHSRDSMARRRGRGRPVGWRGVAERLWERGVAWSAIRVVLGELYGMDLPAKRQESELAYLPVRAQDYRWNSRGRAA